MGGVVGGFVTGLGGFVTMPVALPVNIAEFYVQATRMVGAIATLRGYDVQEPQVRTAVLLTLVGAKADEVLAKAGWPRAAALTRLALGKLPPAALMVVNKAVGFRLMRGVFERVFSRLGRGVPFLGGVIGAVVDGWMMRRIAEQALVEFPAVPTSGGSAMSTDEKPVSDQIKKAVDDLDLEGKVKAAAAAAEDAVFRGLGIAGQYVHEHRDGIEAFLDRAVVRLRRADRRPVRRPVGAAPRPALRRRRLPGRAAVTPCRRRRELEPSGTTPPPAESLTPPTTPARRPRRGRTTRRRRLDGSSDRV